MAKDASTKTSKPTSIAEYEEIIKTACYYVDLIKTGDIDRARPRFHKNATMIGWLDGSFHSVPIQNLFDMVVERGCTPELKHHLTVITMTPTTAIVEVDSELPGQGYRDHLVMAKVDDGIWQIVTKLFHAYVHS